MPNSPSDFNSDTYFLPKLAIAHFNININCTILKIKNIAPWLNETKCQQSKLSTLGGGVYVTRKGQTRFVNLNMSIHIRYVLIYVILMLLISYCNYS